MKVLKYFGFVVLYILYVTLGNTIATYCFNWLSDFVFPINSFLGYFKASIGIMFMGGIVYWFFAGFFRMFNILPKKKIVSMVLGIFYILNFAYAIYLKLENNIEIKNLPIIFGIGCILITMFFAMTKEQASQLEDQTV
jgi:hypothetical protein